MLTKFLYLMVFLCVATSAFAENCDGDCKQKLVRSYFDRLEVIFRKESTVEDIEALLQLFHKDVKYEHIEYQANFDLTAWKEAFLSNWRRNAYKNSPEDSIVISKTINGKSHMAVEYGYGKWTKEGKWLPGDNVELLILFGFKEGKISLVREYW